MTTLSLVYPVLMSLERFEINQIHRHLWKLARKKLETPLRNTHIILLLRYCYSVLKMSENIITLQESSLFLPNILPFGINQCSE